MIKLKSQGTVSFCLPVLVHEFLLSNGEGAEFVAKGVFILTNNDKCIWIIPFSN